MSSPSTSAAVITKISARRVEVEAVRGNTYSTCSGSLGSNLQSRILPELMDAFQSPGSSPFFFGWSCWDPECLWHAQGRQPPGGRIWPGLLVSVCQSMWRCLMRSLAQVSSSSEVSCSSLHQMSNIGPRQEAGLNVAAPSPKRVHWDECGWVCSCRFCSDLKMMNHFYWTPTVLQALLQVFYRQSLHQPYEIGSIIIIPRQVTNEKTEVQRGY